MWNQKPEQLLLMVQQQQAELRHEASEARLASGSNESRHALGHVHGLQLRLGRLLIVVGRTLREEESPCPDAMNS